MKHSTAYLISIDLICLTECLDFNYQFTGFSIEYWQDPEKTEIERKIRKKKKKGKKEKEEKRRETRGEMRQAGNRVKPQELKGRR